MYLKKQRSAKSREKLAFFQICKFSHPKIIKILSGWIWQSHRSFSDGSVSPCKAVQLTHREVRFLSVHSGLYWGLPGTRASAWLSCPGASLWINLRHLFFHAEATPQRAVTWRSEQKKRILASLVPGSWHLMTIKWHIVHGSTSLTLWFQNQRQDP